eukprot:403351974
MESKITPRRSAVAADKNANLHKDSKKRKENPSDLKQDDTKRQQMGVRHKEIDTLLEVVIGPFEVDEKIASFDLDHTIIKPKSNAKFGQSPTDWVFLYDGSVIKDKLHELSKDGYSIVVFTNQGGVEAGHTSVKDLVRKFELIQKAIGLPMLFLAATHSDKYRKPAQGAWEYFLSQYDKSKKLNMKKSFYCGDAAGRPKTADRKKDFSDTDRKFAINIGLPFEVPEQTFLGEKVRMPALQSALKFIEEKKESSKNQEETKNPEKVVYTSDKQEIVLFFGAPGSGKSTFWKNNLSSYARVNNDTLKTPAKCIKVAEQALNEKKSVVIDNTNSTLEQRNRYTAISKALNIPIRCFIFDVPKEVCMHNNNQRKINAHREHLSGKVPAIPIHSFFKNSEKPTMAEGFSEIKTIKFQAGPFDNDEDKKTYYSLS